MSRARPAEGTRLRLLYVSHSFPPLGAPLENVGGIQRAALGLHEALERVPGLRRHDLMLRTSWAATHRRVPFFLARLLATLSARVRRERIDAVLFSSMVTGAVLAVLGSRLRAAGVRTAVIPHGHDVILPFGPYQHVVRAALRQVDLVLPFSRATADACALRGADLARLHRIPCGVAEAVFHPPADRRAARRALLAELGLELPDDALLLVAVGRHERRKGFHWFAEAVLPRLPGHAHLLLAGEGRLTPVLRELASRPALRGRLHLLGVVDDARLARLYQGGDLFVMPNIPVPGDMEGLGIVMLEAGASGLPVIAADLDGIRDVVAEGVNGWLVPAGDDAAFATAIVAAARDGRQLERQRARAVAHVARHFSWAGAAARVADLLATPVRAG